MSRPSGEFDLPSWSFEHQGSRLRYARFPRGAPAAPPLLCFPGYGATGESFARLAPLADRLDVYLLTPPEEWQTAPDVLARYAALMAAFARQFERPILLGTSFGGPIAIEAAAQLGDSIGGLVLISTYAELRNPLRHLIPILPLLEAVAYASLRFGVYVIGGPRLDREAAHALLRQTTSISRREKHARLVSALTCNVEASAKRIEAPVLVLHGTKDRVVPIARGRAMAALFPRAEMHLIDGAGHVPYITHPGAVIDQLDAFARRISQSR